MVKPSIFEPVEAINLAANLLAFGLMMGMVKSFNKKVSTGNKSKTLQSNTLSRQEVLGRIRILSLKMPLEEAIKMFDPVPGGTFI